MHSSPSTDPRRVSQPDPAGKAYLGWATYGGIVTVKYALDGTLEWQRGYFGFFGPESEAVRGLAFHQGSPLLFGNLAGETPFGATSELRGYVMKLKP